MPISRRMIDQGWAAARDDEPEPTVAYFADLLAAHPDDPRAVYEYASALDFAGREAEAAPEYERATAMGLPDEVRQPARIQYGSTLRNLGRHAEAEAVLRGACAAVPDDAAAPAFLALALATGGRPEAAVALLTQTLLDRVPQPLLQSYRRALTGYAAELRSGGPPG